MSRRGDEDPARGSLNIADGVGNAALASGGISFGVVVVVFAGRAVPDTIRIGWPVPGRTCLPDWCWRRFKSVVEWAAANTNAGSSSIFFFFFFFFVVVVVVVVVAVVRVACFCFCFNLLYFTLSCFCSFAASRCRCPLRPFPFPPFPPFPDVQSCTRTRHATPHQRRHAPSS